MSEENGGCNLYKLLFCVGCNTLTFILIILLTESRVRDCIIHNYIITYNLDFAIFYVLILSLLLMNVLHLNGHISSHKSK